MVRSYAPKNRYCRNTKLSEDEFCHLVSGFLAGAGAAAVARANKTHLVIGVVDRSVRTLFQRLRTRLTEDADLTGWMAGGDPSIPPADDEIWLHIHDCLVECPAYVVDRTFTSPGYVQEYRGNKATDKHKQRILTYVRKKHGAKCTVCPIKLTFDFDHMFYDELAKHVLRTGGIPRDSFKAHYFEIMFRLNMRVGNTKFPDARNKVTLDVFMDRLLDRPL